MSEFQPDHKPGLVSRLLHRGVPGAAEIPPSNAVEPCVSCGEETAIGSVFFSDRRSVARPGGTPLFLCSECQARAHQARKGKPLTDAEVIAVTERGKVAGVPYFGGGPTMGGF